MSGQEPSPSLEELRELYEAAIRFQGLGPWNWVSEEDLFGVQDPGTGETGYCCVTGTAGEHFALVVYRGSEGLAGLLQMQSGRLPADPVEVLALQKCLMASFEDRTELQKADLQVIKELGLKFRGRHAWPLFRSYLPGFQPWYVTRGEAWFLTAALEQAREVTLRLRENPRLLTPPRRGQYLVRVPEGEEERRQWHDAWLAPAPLQQAERLRPPPLDEARLQRIQETAAPVRNVWEVDFFGFPGAVNEKGGERPYFPYGVLYVEQQSSLPLGIEMVRPDELATQLVEKFLHHIESFGVLPGEVQVQREEARDLLEPVASRLGIRLKVVRRLRALETMRRELFAFMR